MLDNKLNYINLQIQQQLAYKTVENHEKNKRNVTANRYNVNIIFNHESEWTLVFLECEK